MSRNVDKANSLLVRYQELQAEEAGGYKDYSRYKRPTKIGSVRSLKEAQEWQRQVLNDIQNCSSRVYDPSLGEDQLREVNDELNELYKEKQRWEWHIHNRLGGPRACKAASIGELVAGKRYFGRAVELPEVQENLRRKQESVEQHRKEAGLVNTGRISRDKSSFYYGTVPEPIRDSLINYENSHIPEEPMLFEPEDVGIPSAKDMELWLVERRKKKLLQELDL